MTKVCTGNVSPFDEIVYRIAGMFGGVNVWWISELKRIGKVKFGKWKDFGHKDTNYTYDIKSGWLKLVNHGQFAKCQIIYDFRGGHKHVYIPMKVI